MSKDVNTQPTGSEGTQPTGEQAGKPTDGQTQPNPQPDGAANSSGNETVTLTEDQAKAFKAFSKGDGKIDADHIIELLNKKTKTNTEDPKPTPTVGQDEPPKNPEQGDPKEDQTGTGVQPTEGTKPIDTKLPEGYVSPMELNVKRWFKDDLSPKYDRIPVSEFEDGTVINKLNEFGIKVSDANGNLNQKQVETFLNMYNETKPAPTPTAVPGQGSAPIAEYKEVENLSEDPESAKKIFEAGDQKHPQWAEAVKVMAKAIAKS